jgi:hypothetical protein
MLKIEIPMGSTYSKVQAVALNFQKKNWSQNRGKMRKYFLSTYSTRVYNMPMASLEIRNIFIFLAG